MNDKKIGDLNIIKNYVRHSKAFYSKAFPNENVQVSIVLSGDISCKFIVEWVLLDNKFAPRLRCFDDAWLGLSKCSELISKLAELNDMLISEPCFCKELDKLGYNDITDYERTIK